MKAFPVDHGFDGLYGLEVLELGENRARARVSISDGLKLPHGFVHGGVYSSLAEGLASLATETALDGEGAIAVALANHTSVLHPVADGSIEAVAVRRHRGRTTWVWEIDMSDGEGRLCVVGRVTVAIRAEVDHRGGAPRPSQ